MVDGDDAVGPPVDDRADGTPPQGGDSPRPRNLWADVPRRAAPPRLAAPRGAAPLAAPGAPPALSAPGATVPAPAAPALPSADRAVDDAAPVAVDVAHEPSRTSAARVPATPRARRRRRLLVRAGVPVVVVALAAAIAVPKLLGPDEPRLLRPTTQSLPDPTALRPELVFGEDLADEMPLPPPLEGAAEAPTGVEERWRLTAGDLAAIWADAGADAEGADAPQLVTAATTSPGAAHEPNLSGVVPFLLTGHGAPDTWSSRRLLVGFDAQDGSVRWTWAFDAAQEVPCQVVGRGAHVACSDGPHAPDDVSTRVTVLDTKTGEQVTSFHTETCSPDTFLQHGTRLYWAGTVPTGMDVCVGGGKEHFATLTSGGYPDDRPTIFTLSQTGPIARSSGASVMLTEDGWHGFDGWVAPGPSGLIIRQITTEATLSENIEDVGAPNVTTVVSKLDGTTVLRAQGPAWHRLDLLPDAEGSPELAQLVGIGADLYDTSGERRLTLQAGEEKPYVVPAYVAAPTVTETGVHAYVTYDETEGWNTTARWTLDQVLAGEPGEQHESARTFITEVDGVSVFLDGQTERLEETPLGALGYLERGVVVESDGHADRLAISVLYSRHMIDDEGQIDYQRSYVLMGWGAQAMTVVGSTIVALDDGGIVAVS
ncbi:hypothetical protein ATL41_1180 [Flavimobilis soli]|uniref:Uncharacterized protein n=1 Tax=Flavimobilis soli TaxID=442709 RepID=A0A2A9EC33_9MICO|nr:hypothetical protein [Flavimobilis soli]PFG36454.1 hypothetical protein ATL41_1180 [Flavimobilis soli]